MKNFKPEITVQTIESLIEAYESKDLDTVKVMFNSICENNPPDALDRHFLIDINVAMQIFKFFHETGLVDAPTGSPTKLFFYRITRYLLDNGSQELKQIFEDVLNKLFPNIKSNGFNETGKNLYGLDDIAKGLGVSSEDLLGEARSIPGFKFIRANYPPKGTTEH